MTQVFFREDGWMEDGVINAQNWMKSVYIVRLIKKNIKNYTNLSKSQIKTGTQ